MKKTSAKKSERKDSERTYGILLDGRELSKNEYGELYNLLLPFTMKQSG